jgi:DNA-binding NarL/FixJ family response regulator
MSTDSLEHLVLEELREAYGVEKKMLVALTSIANGDPAPGLRHVLTQLLAATELRGKRLDVMATIGTRASNRPRLTAREAQVAQMIAEGYASKQIAAELGISIKTVEKHRQHLMAKLDLHDVAGVTRYAFSVGLIKASA